jgi:hypothetical protein
MRRSQAQITVMAADKRYWQSSEAALSVPPLLRGLFTAQSSTTIEQPQNGQSARERLLNAPVEERAGLLRDLLHQQIAAVVGTSTDAVDIAIPITSLGIDSLMAVEIRNRLDKNLSLNVAVASILEGPSILQLVELLKGQLDGDHHTTMPEAVAESAADWEEGAL